MFYGEVRELALKTEEQLKCGENVKQGKNVTKRKRVKRFLHLLLAVVLAVAFLGFNQALKIQSYTLYEEKIHNPVRVALLTDLHSCKYGENQQELIAAIDSQKPDLIFMVGDMIDDEIPDKYIMDLVKDIGSRYDCYYVTGNHEIWADNAEVMKGELESAGVTVLDGQCITAEVGGQKLNIAGVDDPAIGNVKHLEQLIACSEQNDPEMFSILLAHRPERIQTYAQYGFDLIVSGHAHGGQWRIPFFCNGLYAPTQGWFPEYVGGYYQVDEAEMVVSRGLARETNMLPRFFNRPELVMIDILPEEEGEEVR